MKRLPILGILSFVFVSGAWAADTVVVSVPDMMCGGCVAKVTKALEKQKGVSNVAVSLDSHEASFTCQKTADAKSKSESCNLDDIMKALSKAGYPGSLKKGT